MGPLKPVIDALYRIAYRRAYRLMRVYWGVRHPNTHGALVAVWHEGRVLLIRNSYVPYYCFPGGYVGGSETSREAARRELKEEVGVSVGGERLERKLDVTHEWEGKRDHVEIFELELRDRPTVEADNREVIQAEFFDPKAALGLDLFPPARWYIEERLSASADGRAQV